MDLKLGNLNDLKTWLLPEDVQSDSDFDDAIEALGKGVAEAMERFCNRKFGRVENETVQFGADRNFFVVPRYPIEGTPTLEIRTAVVDGWESKADSVYQVQEKAGLVYFAGYLGSYMTQARLTYTGGFWYDTSEDYSGSLPSGATQVPSDLKLAWKNQCSLLWERRDKLGIPLANNPPENSALEDIQWLPHVTEILKRYQRMQMV